jgi:hypothetical protein
MAYHGRKIRGDKPLKRLRGSCTEAAPATLPCPMTGQDRVIFLSSMPINREVEKRIGEDFL